MKIIQCKSVTFVKPSWIHPLFEDTFLYAIAVPIPIRSIHSVLTIPQKNRKKSRNLKPSSEVYTAYEKPSRFKINLLAHAQYNIIDLPI